MKKVLSALVGIASLVSISTTASATETYTDTNGVVWTIEGPAVGRWRPFPDAAARCPSHHVTAEPRPLYTGGFTPTREQRATDKAAGVQTMHIKCLGGPAVASSPVISGVTPPPTGVAPQPPAVAQVAPPNSEIRRPPVQQRPMTIEVIDDGKI